MYLGVTPGSWLQSLNLLAETTHGFSSWNPKLQRAQYYLAACWDRILQKDSMTKAERLEKLNFDTLTHWSNIAAHPNQKQNQGPQQTTQEATQNPKPKNLKPKPQNP